MSTKYTDDDIKTIVLDAIAARTSKNSSNISTSNKLYKDLNFDSLDTVEMCADIEEVLQVDFPDEFKYGMIWSDKDDVSCDEIIKYVKNVIRPLGMME